MTVAALIVANAADQGAHALARIVDAAWSGGAHPILVTGLASGVVPPLPARAVTFSEPEAALAEAVREVQATSALVILPIAHAGIDPESITALIAAHGRAPGALLVAAHDGRTGPVRLLPAKRTAATPEQPVETGDEAVLVASDGSLRLRYDAPPAERDTVDPWERRGEAVEES